jgi:hypothetical protein
LEMMPLRMNRSKGDKIGERQRALERKLRGLCRITPGAA